MTSPAIDGGEGLLGHVIVISDPQAGLSLTDESLWTIEECERDAPQVEADFPGAKAIIAEVRAVRKQPGSRSCQAQL